MIFKNVGIIIYQITDYLKRRISSGKRPQEFL